MAQQRVMVTGGAGYIGSIITQQLLQKGFQVIAVDNFSTGYKEALDILQSDFPAHLHSYHHDLLAPLESIFKKESPLDAVFHLAGKTAVDESMRDPAVYFENNTAALLNLLTAMEQYRVTQLIFSSTAAVYGESETLPILESHPTRPVNPYGESKLMAEQIINWFGKQKDLRYTIFRYFNVCGGAADGSLGDARPDSGALVLNAVKGTMGIIPFQLTCSPVSTPDGTPIRDYIDVLDVAKAHLLAYAYLSDGGKSETINLGSTRGYSVHELVRTVETMTGVKIPTRHGSTRQGEAATIVASNTKARQLLGWKPTRTIEESIKSTRAWLTTHPHGWK
ncbi:UDP-glucose 4-epimerase GalE [Candidatus Roizmanbacteria bacterium]|nr:UDP-glucose 4-epimerase GalE [Candidatus Roizmanbacteria bacterium]